MATNVANGRITIIDTNDGVSTEMVRSSIIIPTDNAGTIGSYTGVETTMKVYVGGIDDSANWTFYVSLISVGIAYRDSDDAADRTATGVSAGLITGTTGYFKIVSLTADSGYVEVTAIKNGYAAMTRRLDVVKSKAGATGSTGLTGQTGQTGQAGSDALSIVLSNESQALPADAAGNVSSYTGASTTAKVYRGIVDETASWSFTKLESSASISSTISTNTVTITSMAAASDTQYVDITATRAGYASLTKRFTVTKAKTGSTGPTGSTGSTGPRGTVQLARSITTSTWSDSEAVAALTAAGYGSAVSGDVVTLYNNASTPKFSEARVYSGSWQTLAAYFNGSLLVDGTVIAQKIDTKGLSIKTTTGATLLSESVPLPAADNLWTGNLASATGNLGGGNISATGITDARGSSTAVNVNLPVAPSYVYYRVFNMAGRPAGWYNVTLKVYVTSSQSIVVSATDGSSWNASEYKLATTTSGTPVWVSVTVRQYVASTSNGLDVVIGSYHKGTPVSSLPASTTVSICDLSVVLDRYEGDVNATYGATLGTNLRDSGGTVMTNDRLLNNLADVGWWNQDAAIPWTQNAEYNRMISVSPNGGLRQIPGPRGGADIVWWCQEISNNGEQGGGWNGGTHTPLDTTKTYRFVLPVRRLSGAVHPNNPGAATAYWGTTGVCDLNTTTVNGNPYFAADHLPVGKWYLFVGFVFPAGSVSNSHAGSGIYDCSTGALVKGGTNYCFSGTNGNITHRAYQYYATNNSEQVFGRPLINLVDGTEPSLREYFEPAATLNGLAPLGQNLIPNSEQSSVMTWADGVSNGVFDVRVKWASEVFADNTYALVGTSTRNVTAHQNNNTGGGDFGPALDMYPLGSWVKAKSVVAIAGQRYCFSAYVASHRCWVGGGIYFFDSADNPLGSVEMTPVPPTNDVAYLLSAYRRPFVFATAPAGTTHCRVYIRKYNTVVGGTESWIWVAAPQLEAVSSMAVEPSPYQPGPISNVLHSNAVNTLLGTGGLKTAGDLIWDADGNVSGNSGVAITAKGITARYNGVTKFTLDAATGNAGFAGDISAATGTFGGNVRGGQFTGGAITGWGWPAAGSGPGFYVGPNGILLGNYNDNRWLQLSSNGDISAPGFSTNNGTLTISQVNVINTLNVANESITVPRFTYNIASNQATVSIVVKAGKGYGKLLISASVNVPRAGYSQDITMSSPSSATLRHESVTGGTIPAMFYTMDVGLIAVDTTYTFTVINTDPIGEKAFIQATYIIR